MHSRGDLVRTSLAQGAQLVQASLLIGTKQEQPGEEEHGQESLGEHALCRMYQASDGWIFIAALPAEKTLLTNIKAFEDLTLEILNCDEKTQLYIQQKLSFYPVDHWVEVFTASGFGVHRVDSLQEVTTRYLHEGQSQELQSVWNDGRTLSWLRFTDHPAGTAVELSAPAHIRLQNAKIRLLQPTPKQGTHTREILVELGYSEETICLLYTSPSPRDLSTSRMPSSA